MGLLDDAIREHLDLKRQRGADPGEVERLEREALGPVRREPTARTMGAVPHLEVNVDSGQEFEPATELLQEARPTRSPKRGFLRRNRSAATRQPERSDFDEPLGTEVNGERGTSNGDPSDHRNPFGQDQFDSDDPFPQDEPATHDEPVTSEHAGRASTGESAPAVPMASEPTAGASEVGGEPPHLVLDTALPKRPTFAPVPPSTTEPEAEPVHPDAARETREWSVEDAFAAEDTGQEAPAADPVEEDVLEETPEFLQDTPDHDRLWFEQRPPRDFDFDG